MKRGLIAGFIAAAALAAPATASADTWCVQYANCPTGSFNVEPTIQAAVNAAATGDTILIGPGKFMEQVSQPSSKVLTYIGSGPTQTVIQSPSTAAGSITLNAQGSGNLVENLGVELPAAANGYGLWLAGDAVGVAVTAPAGTTSGTGVETAGGTFDHGSVTLPTGAASSTTGISTIAAPGGAVQDSTIMASYGTFGIVKLARDRIQATSAVSENNVAGGNGTNITAAVDDALIQTIPGPVPEEAVTESAQGGASPTFAQFAVRHSTIIGSGTAGSTGIGLTAAIGGAASDVTAQGTIDSTIVRGFANAVSRTATGSGGHNATANVNVDYSNFDTSTEASVNNGSPAGTGAIANGSHDFPVDPVSEITDPGFVNTNFGDPLGFHLSAISSLIDAGNPVLAAGESSTDADGNPREVAGRVGALARPGTRSDIGAFEYEPHQPVVSIATAPTAAVVGQPVYFIATATDADPTDRFYAYWWQIDGAPVTYSERDSISRAFTTSGPHTAMVTVPDSNGYEVSASISVNVLPAVTPGVISRFALSRHRFRAAPAGQGVVPARALYGTVVTYAVSQPATTTFTIQRPSRGRRLGRLCIKAGRTKTTRRARCTSYTPVGSFTRADAGGPSHFRFTGRIKGHKLARGSYRLQAVPTNSAGSGPPVFANFHIIR